MGLLYAEKCPFYDFPHIQQLVMHAERLGTTGTVPLHHFTPFFKPNSTSSSHAMAGSLRNSGAFFHTGNRLQSSPSPALFTHLCIRPSGGSQAKPVEGTAAQRSVSLPRLSGFWAGRRGTPLGGGFARAEKGGLLQRRSTQGYVAPDKVRLRPHFLVTCSHS